MDQLCPKCATGTCPWRDGIMCRHYVCARDDAEKRSLLLIDNWVTVETLDLFAKKRKDVKVTVITSEHYKEKVPHHAISAAFGPFARAVTGKPGLVKTRRLAAMHKQERANAGMRPPACKDRRT